MNTTPSTAHTALSLLALAGSLCTSAAQADTVDLVGGFRDYYGPLQTPDARLGNQQTVFTTPDFTVPGIPTDPVPGCPGCAGYGIGLGGVGFYGGPIAPPHRVEFYQDSPTNPPPRNAIEFTPSTGLDLQVGDTFKLGTFTFTNGGWLSAEFGAGAFEFQIHTVSANPALDAHYMNIHLGLHVTNGISADGSYYSPAPIDNADFFYIQEYPELGYVGVYESEPELQPPNGSNTGSIDLYGRIGSLIPTGFANAQGVVLAAALPVVQAPVPEPAGWALLLAGLGLSLRAARRKQR